MVASSIGRNGTKGPPLQMQNRTETLRVISLIAQRKIVKSFAGKTIAARVAVFARTKKM